MPQGTWVKKIIDGVETDWLSRKEKVPGTAVGKKGHAGIWEDSLLLISLNKV